MAKPETLLRLLMVEDSLTHADDIANILRRCGYTVRAARHDKLSELKQALTEKSWDLIICRDNLADLPAKQLLEYLYHLGKDIPCIILTAAAETSDELYDLGAQDIIPLAAQKRLQFAVNREIKNLATRRLNRRNEKALRASEQRSQLLVDMSRDAVAYLHEGIHIYANQSYLSLLAYRTAADVDGLPILDIFAHSQQQKIKVFLRSFSEKAANETSTLSAECLDQQQREFTAQVTFSHIVVEGETCIQVTVKEHPTTPVVNEQVLTISPYDELTGLYNRRRFMEQLATVSDQVRENNQIAQLLYIVLDNFRPIKEQVGLSTSEMIIKSTAQLLANKVIDNEFLAHYSDKVFTVIIASGDDDYVDQRAEVYRQTIENYTSQADGKTIDLRCSIGISRITENLTSIAEALDNADHACGKAQRAGGDCISRHQVIAAETELGSQEKGLWISRIETALATDKLILYYQPIVSLNGQYQELYDVLLRMQGNDDMVIQASEFIHYAQQAELITNIDFWVIDNALNNLAIQCRSHPKTRFFLKLAKETLFHPNFIDWLQNRLTHHGVDGSAVVFEIGETVIIDSLQQSQTIITKLKQLGCEFGLAHFGSGLDFSHTLSVLDVDYLKINGSFIENMAKNKENQATVKATVAMTQQAGKQSIAEFVSDASSLALLWRLGVDYALGYYIQKPSSELDYNFADD